jgi:hypothetical protein
MKLDYEIAKRPPPGHKAKATITKFESGEAWKCEC